MTDLPETPESDTLDTDSGFVDDGVLYDVDVTPEYGILGFTLRELLIVGVWLVTFVLSFFPLGWSPALWAQGVAWILPIGVPTAAVFLIVLRRFSPDGIRRVGSLGIDQFASVAFSVAAVWWVQMLWEYLATVIATGLDAVVWVPWAQLLLSLALVALTVFAPIIPGLKDDFHGRLVTLAHRNANPVRPVIPRPRPEPVVAPELAPVDEAEAGVEPAAAAEAEPAPSESVTVAYSPAAELDVELSGQHATDEIARVDLAAQVPLAAHASGGGTGTEQVTADEEYTPVYSRRSRGEEIVSDTDSIVALVTPDTDAVEPIAVEPVPSRRSGRDADAEASDVDVEATNPRESSADSAREAAVEPQQPFWVLAPSERDVHDERGDVIFTIGPTAWALVIEDRGGAFVVRHDDGRIGYLHDISDITKG